MQEYHYVGLTDDEVALSRKKYGSNQLTKEKKQGFFQQFLSNFGDPIIKVLLAALAINLIFIFQKNDWYETIGIAVAVLLATLVSTISEYGSDAAFEKLQQSADATKCRVLRNGRLCEVELTDLVVGDIVLLQAGESVPADGTLLEGFLRVDQSALNGESKESIKQPLPASQHQSDPLTTSSTLLRGSVICSGNGVMKIDKNGDETFYGLVAKELQTKTRESPLKLRLSILANHIGKLGFVAAGCVAFADLFYSIVIKNGFSLSRITEFCSSPTQLFGCVLSAAMLAISVVVVAVPEGLPMMITVVLSANMRRMLNDNVLVRKLVGIETSGNLTILFTDKTGTLTKGNPQVSVLLDGEGSPFQYDRYHRKNTFWELITLSCFYNTDSMLSGKEILGGNATEKALLAYIQKRHPINTDCCIQKKESFDSNKKWSGVQIEGNFSTLPFSTRKHMTFIKGAPDKLLPLCNRYVTTDGEIRTLNATTLQHQKESLEKEAMRLILLTVCEESLQEELPQNLILLSLVGLRDELRSDVRRTVKEMDKAGIQTVMVTGDSRETACAIAKNAGLLSYSKNTVLTGSQLADMTDMEVKSLLPSLRVVARALPNDKSRLVRLAQEAGQVVGMTGDGINDAAALKKSDVGFAMGTATAVAKEAGDIVILDNRFSSIGKAVLYGRTIFKSIRKFIVFQLTMNLCAVGISVIGPFLGINTPVTVMQMLWINIIMDTLAGLAFAGEPPLDEYLNEPPKKQQDSIMNRYMLNQILCTGFFTISLCVAFLQLPIVKDWFRYKENPLFWLSGFFTLFVFCGIFNSFNARTTRLNLLAYLRKNGMFIAVMCLIVMVQIALTFFGTSLFRTAPLTFNEWKVILGLSFSVIPFDVCRKILLRLCHRKGHI